MRAISLFSGVGGLDMGFERAGIETVLQAEQDQWCLEVLARHWPETERVTDVRDVQASGLLDAAVRGGGCDDVTGEGEHVSRHAAGSIDLIYGGFPCQDVSVAGKRAGLDGERSGLWFEFERILRELRPRWAVIENVPGLLSSNGGRDFGVILDGLDELGFDVAWTILDAQHFGVPQRRRRVFIVAGPSRRSVEQVLSLCEGCGGNPETGSEAGEGVAATLRGRSHGVGVNPPGRGGEEAYGDNLIALADDDLAFALNARDWKGINAGHGNNNLVAHPISASNAVRTSQRESDTTFVVAHTLQSETYHHGGIPNQTANGDNGFMQATASGVRRLTPLECERLMGWPDDWTRWTADGKEIADSHRYRMAGNGVVASVAEWIGHRLVAVDKGLV